MSQSSNRFSSTLLLAGMSFWVSSTLSSLAWAAYPDHPIRLIIPYAAGGPTDVLGRLVGQKMGEVLKQTVVIDNRPGAGANVGILAVSKSTPDGYTLLFGDRTQAAKPCRTW